MADAPDRGKTDEADRAAPRAGDFFAAVRDANPFAANRVTEPSRYDVDVAAIHGAAFDRLTALAGRAMRERSGVGAVLLGGAGVGKSHLLSRLYRWAGEPAGAGGGGPRACYVYLHNILADPNRLPRYLLKYVVSRLSEGGGGRGPLHRTPLWRFVDRALRHAQAASKAAPDRAGEPIDAYRAFFGKSVLAVPGVIHVLNQFRRHARPEKADDRVRRRLAAEAVAWLSGDEIDPAAARELGLNSNGREPAMLGDDHEVEQVLLALTGLAHVSGQPFLLCIDQIDNLDPDKVESLSRFLHALLDHASNLLVVVSGVKQTLIKFRDEVITESTWDRLAQYKVELSRVSPVDARKIVEARLERFHEPFVGVDAVRLRVHEDTLFPLGRGWLDAKLGDAVEVRPRDVLTWARDAWEDAQAALERLGGEAWVSTWPHAVPAPVEKTPVAPAELERAVDDLVDRKIEEQIAQHRLQPGSLPPDAGNLTGLVEVLLGQCRGGGLPYTFREVERPAKTAGKLPPYDLLVRERREPDGREVTTGVLFVTNVGLSATAALRRLLEDEAPPDHRLLVTDEERRGLKVGPRGVEYYRGLEALGPGRFEHLKIDFEQYAALDALRDVTGTARSGDLEVEAPRGTTRPVTEAEVIASHHRRDRYRRHPLLRPLLTEDPTPVEPERPPPRPGLDESDVRQYVRAQLAWQMGSTAQAIARGYVGAMRPPARTFEDAWPQVKAIVGRMHAEGLVHATPQDDDLYLLLRK